MNRKSESGITLVALVVSIIIMLILASVTLSTSFTAYETTRAEKFKAQLKVVQEAVNSTYSDWQSWNSAQENGDTSIDSFFDHKKNLDSYPYELESTTLADLKLEIPDECYNEVSSFLGTKPDQSSFYIFHDNTNSISDEDIIDFYLGAKNIDIPIYVNFENLVVFTTKPVKVDGKNVYTQYSFSDSNIRVLSDTESTIKGASILIDVKANYGTSQKITLTLESPNPSDNNQVEYKIRKAYYQNNYINGSTNNNSGTWYEVDDLKECEYSEDGKSVTFIVYESGNYRFRIEDVSGAYTISMKQDTELNIKNKSKNDRYEEITNTTDKNGKIVYGTYNITLCNAPVLNNDMLPVKWIYEDEKKINGKWVVCTTIDPEWYNYSEDNKMWANVMLIHDKNTNKELTPGTELSETEMGSMFVWIPRYAKNGDNIQFLRDKSDTTTYGQTMYVGNTVVVGKTGFRNTDSKNGGWDSELKGLWFAKYDIGLEDVNESNKNITKVNTSIESNANSYNKLYSSNQTFRPVSKPYYITWRNISFTNAFSQSVMYYTKLTNASDKKDLNSHLMKSTEWDILYGITKNKYGNDKIEANQNNKFSGGSDGVSGYTVQNFTNQSSNANMTGIFDVIGTTNVMLAKLGLINTTATSDSEFIYDSLGNPINKYSSNNDLNNKYVSLVRNQKTIFIGENKKSSWVSVSNCISQDIGFRIVLANSPSGDRSNFLYDNTNVDAIGKEDLPGFYVTNDDGVYIKNAYGEFKDSNGLPTFYPWNEMKQKGWINVQDGTTVKAGTNILELKGKTGILVVSDTISKIGYNAFGNWCTNGQNGGLLKVIMPDSITDIEGSAFSSCKQLKSIKFSKQLKNIGSNAFYECENLVNLSLPNSLKTIDLQAFYNCKKIESITLWENVTNVGKKAFLGCSNLEDLEILSGCELTLDDYSFCSTNINSLLIPSRVIKIGDKAFQSCDNLEFVKMEDGIQNIETGVFSYCTKLSNINIPSSVTNFGYSTDFHTLNDGSYTNGNYSGIFQGCTSLTEIDLSNCNVGIVYGAFRNCYNLKNVELPRNLTSIGVYAFNGCYSLNNIRLPKTVKNIYSHVFSSRDGELLEISFDGTLNEWNEVIKAENWYDNDRVTVTTSEGEQIMYE